MVQANKQGFSALWVLALLVIATAASFAAFKIKQSDTKMVLPTAALVNSVPSQTPSLWKTYHNDKYGFSITYPRIGVVLNKEGKSQGECGSASVSDSGTDIDSVIIDNFFEIRTIKWSGSIADYMKSQGAAKVYDTHAIVGSNADEALALDNLAKGVEYARGYPPLVYTKALFIKNGKLFIMKYFQNPDNFGGCILPQTVDPSQYPEIAKQKWEMTGSLKFL